MSPQPDDVVNVAVDKVNGLLESFMGINDTELGKTPTHWHYTTPRLPTDHRILRSIMKTPHGSYYCYTLYKCKSKDHKWRNALQMKKKLLLNWILFDPLLWAFIDANQEIETTMIYI